MLRIVKNTRILRYLALLVLITTLSSWPVMGRVRTSSFDVSYIWTSHLGKALICLKQVGSVLDYNSRRKLRLVRESSGNYGAIYDLNGDKASAMAVLQKHAELLKNTELDSASVVEDAGYHDLYNISYGLGPNLEVQKENYKKIVRILGREVGRNLVIQKTAYGNYALIYIRRGEEQSTRSVARRHSKLLRSVRLRAAIIRENVNNDVIYSQSLGNVPESLLKIPIKPEKTIRKTKVEKPRVQAPQENLSLQEQIERYVSDLKRTRTISQNDKFSCSVYDFTTGKKVVSINEDIPLQCASMFKPFVALAFFHQVKNGNMIYGPKSKAKMKAMIQRSRNTETNWVMRQLGGPAKVQDILKTNYSGIFTDTIIREYIPKGGQTYRNKASAHDYSRFLYAMWNGNLPYSIELRRLMALPNRDRVCMGAKHVPSATLVYDKTGSTAYLIGNMAILVAKGKDGKRYPYTLICIIQKSRRASNYTVWKNKASNIIREVSNKVYIDMKKRHRLI
ncbi:hypothetical protein GF312_03250 [Candidatus Poribacteria bacterium]|nr:hypothetical protein [Candidatus Poribacteria bacterium]